MPRRTVLVTGGSSGIGAATVRRFTAAGDRVWYTYHPSEPAPREPPGRAFPLDLGDLGSHRALVDVLPVVDVLVNNAAPGTATVQRYAPGDRHAQDEIFMRAGVLGPLWLTEALLPGMLERGHGKILFVASVGGGVGVFPQFRTTDGMAKAAVAYLTRHLAAELVHTPLHVAAVCPGAVDTPMLHASTLDPMDKPDRERFIHRLPKHRLIQPGEIADVLWWLSTDHARVTHGAVIDASMGLGVHPGLVAFTPGTSSEAG